MALVASLEQTSLSAGTDVWQPVHDGETMDSPIVGHMCAPRGYKSGGARPSSWETGLHGVARFACGRSQESEIQESEIAGFNASTTLKPTLPVSKCRSGR